MSFPAFFAQGMAVLAICIALAGGSSVPATEDLPLSVVVASVATLAAGLIPAFAMWVLQRFLVARKRRAKQFSSASAAQ